ncbi:hypothetical protein D3C80_296600 [compost metagenome]
MVIGDAEGRRLFRVDGDRRSNGAVLGVGGDGGEGMVAAHRLHQLVRPVICRVGIQALNDKLVLAGGAASTKTQALLRVDIGADAGHFRCGLPQFRQHLAERCALFLGFQFNEHRTVVERIAGIATDDGGHVHNGGVLADLVGNLGLKVTHRSIGNVFACLRRHGKTANILLWKEAGGQGFEQVERGGNRCQKRRKNHAAVGKTPAHRTAISTERSLETRIEPADDGGRAGGMAGKTGGQHRRHCQRDQR